MQKKPSNDKYNSVWVSHSSIGDFLKCPRSYFLKNIYKDENSRKKVGIVNPALSLGSAVHEVVEGLANVKAEERKSVPILEIFEDVWKKFEGKKGGFLNKEDEESTKKRGIAMIERVKNNIEPLLYKTVKIKGGKNDMPPNYFLSEEENIILCGKIDWLQYISENDSIHVIDFKTGQNEEKEDSLQLPIYQLLLNNLQKRKVSGASYWYLDREDKPNPVELPNIDESYKKVFENAMKVKNARKENKFDCPKGLSGCFFCKPFEKIIKGEAEYVGSAPWQNLYILS